MGEEEEEKELAPRNPRRPPLPAHAASAHAAGVHAPGSRARPRSLACPKTLFSAHGNLGKAPKILIRSTEGAEDKRSRVRHRSPHGGCYRPGRALLRCRALLQPCGSLLSCLWCGRSAATRRPQDSAWALGSLRLQRAGGSSPGACEGRGPVFGQQVWRSRGLSRHTRRPCAASDASKWARVLAGSRRWPRRRQARPLWSPQTVRPRPSRCCASTSPATLGSAACRRDSCGGAPMSTQISRPPM